MILSYIKWALIAILTVFFAFITILISLISPKFAALSSVKIWGKLILTISGVRLKINGLQNIKNKPTIVMYNHKSYYDIFSFASFMNYDWRAMMKKELLDIPFFGTAVKIMDHYFVSRDGSFSDRREVVKIIKKIKKGKIIFIAPEGTRNPEKGLLDFKDGGFYISLKTKVNIVPMIIKNADEITKKGSLKINPGKIEITILPEINVSEYQKFDDPVIKLRNDVKEIFNSYL